MSPMTLSPVLVESIGTVAAVLTTLCWVPQAMKIIREKRTEGVSLVTNLVFALGILLWLAYGLLIGSFPLILANVVTLSLIVVIIALKIRYG